MKIPGVTTPYDVRYALQVVDTLTTGAETDGAILSKTDLIVLDGVTLASSKSIIEMLATEQGSDVPDVARPAPTVVDSFVHAAAAVVMRTIGQESPIQDHAAAVAGSIAPAFHLFPYNRRLDTNGVDDGLILSSALFDVRQLVPKPVDVLIPQILPVVPATALVPLTPEIDTAASHQRESASDADDRILDTGLLDDLILHADLPEQEPVTTAAAAIALPAKATSQAYQCIRSLASQQVIPTLMSDQRRTRMAERAAFWVWVDMVRFRSTSVHSKGIEPYLRCTNQHAASFRGCVRPHQKMQHFSLGEAGHYRVGLTIYIRIIYLMLNIKRVRLA